MLLALILVTLVTVLLVWLLFSLAALALPLFVGMLVGQTAFHAGAGFLGASLIGLLGGAATLFVGQFLFATLRGSAPRTALILVFAAPAAMAGYGAGHGVAAIGTASPLVLNLFGVVTAAIVAGAAIGRLRAGLPDTPDDAGNAGMLGEPIHGSPIR